MSYREVEGVGTNYETLSHPVSGSTTFGLEFSEARGEARLHIQNDGSNGVTVRLQRRPKKQGSVADKEVQSDPQWWSYAEESIGNGDAPITIVTELSDQYEYRLQAKATSGTSSVSAWSTSVVGEAI
jgi:hypothetical protein